MKKLSKMAGNSASKRTIECIHEIHIILYFKMAFSLFIIMRLRPFLNQVCAWFLEITFIPPKYVCVSIPKAINNKSWANDKHTGIKLSTHKVHTH